MHMTDAALEPSHAATAYRRGLSLAVLLLGLMLAACGTPPQRSSGLPPPPAQDGAPSNPPDVSKVPDAVPRPEARSRYGNPETYTVMGKQYRTMEDSAGYVENGGASWYGTKFHGQRTSSGEPYDMYAMSAAHRTLPIPSYARVTNLTNQRSVVVRINDRGPFHSGRIIDLSYTAAARIGMLGSGTANVEVRALEPVAVIASASESGRATPVTVTRAPDSGPRAQQTAGNSRLYLQVGAFTKRTNATTLVSRLHQADFSGLRISPATHRNTTVYRVQIGPLASAADAQRASERLSRLGLGISMPQMVVD